MPRRCRACGRTDTERTSAGRCKPCYNASCRAAKARRWEAHKAESRAWRKANQARLAADRLNRRRTDPAYAAKIAEQAARNRKSWRAENPAAHRAHEAKRRAAKAGNGGSFTPEEWAALCEKFGHRCACCDASAPLSADHVIPVTKGGPSSIDNIQPLCTPCNCRKGVQIIDYRPEAA